MEGRSINTLSSVSALDQSTSAGKVAAAFAHSRKALVQTERRRLYLAVHLTVAPPSTRCRSLRVVPFHQRKEEKGRASTQAPTRWSLRCRQRYKKWRTRRATGPSSTRLLR